jgi:hypothetical protein
MKKSSVTDYVTLAGDVKRAIASSSWNSDDVRGRNGWREGISGQGDQAVLT